MGKIDKINIYKRIYILHNTFFFFFFLFQYSLVKRFHDIQQKIDVYKSQVGDVICNSSALSKIHIKDNFDTNTCSRAMLCVSYMHYIKTKDEFTYEDYLYMYYSIYNNLGENNNRSEIYNICNALINASGYESKDICKHFSITGFSYNELGKIKNLYNMYKSLENIKKHYCQSKENDDFCKSAKDIINEYYPSKHDPSCQGVIYKVPVTQHASISIPILITIITMLIMSILLFIVFKFTPYGSYLVRILKSIRNMFNNINEEQQVLEASELSGIICNGSRYNVLYHCE
ncbi:variable surface protein [Plasmodium gonderi]|uniref:Variable surface protein n=1 Tax=Plasmodium gonderi TaxID=77519 RepID=A0A1Y1JUM7_PLAGO|nr:variable surface protein [Plasmodium gonderi]GAW84113.1 variable surface protein [Plasmodium gonderi]